MNSELEESLDFLRKYVSKAETTRSTTPSRVSVNSALRERQLSASSAGLHRSPVAASGLLTSPNDSAKLLSSSSSADPITEQRQQLQAVITFLRKRYSDDPISVMNYPLSSLTEEDITSMLDAFGREVRSVVHKEKTKMSLIRDGMQKRVNFAPSKILHDTIEPAVHDKDDKAADASATRHTPSVKHSRNDSPPTDNRSESHTRTPRAQRSSSNSKSSKRALKAALKMLREGETVVKFSSKAGKPQRRFLRVADRRGGVETSGAITPHLCWSLSASDDPGTSQLSLLALKQSTLGQLSRIVPRDSANTVRGESGEAISMNSCVQLYFDKRGSLDLAFRNEDTAASWHAAFLLVIAKNAQIAGKDDDDD